MTRTLEARGGPGRLWAGPAAVLALTLAGCAPVGKAECRAGDWARTGYEDGRDGRAPERFALYAQACAGTGQTADAAAYEAGREQGLQLYCTPQNAHALGKAGRALRPVCDAPSIAVPLERIEAAHAFGAKWWDIERQLMFVRMDRREGLGAGGALSSDIALIPARISRLRREQRGYAYWPPLR